MSTAATVQSQGPPRLPVGAGEAVEATEAVPGEVRADTQEAGGGRAQRRGHTREHGDSQRRYLVSCILVVCKKRRNSTMTKQMILSTTRDTSFHFLF